MKKDIDEAWLNYLRSLHPNTTVTTSSVKVRYKQAKPLINLPLEALFELYANLVMAGFEKDEALAITCSVIKDDNERAS